MIENDLDRFIMNTAVFKRWLGNVHALEPCKRTCAPVQIPMIPAIDDLKGLRTCKSNMTKFNIANTTLGGSRLRNAWEHASNSHALSGNGN